MKRNDKCVVDRVMLPSPRYVHILTPRTSNYVSCCLVAKSCPNLFQSHGLKLARCLCPWYFPGKNTGMGRHFLLQGIFLTQGWKPRLLHCRHIL